MTTWPRPSVLARSNAAPAARSASDSSASPPNIATPSPALADRSRPSTSKGAAKARSSRAATTPASSMLCTFSIRTPNSSPHIRTTVADGPAVISSRWATSRRSSSPAACPKDSLTAETPSTPSTITATNRPVFADRTRAAPSRSVSTSRVARFVSGSVRMSSRSLRCEASCCTATAASCPASPSSVSSSVVGARDSVR